MGHHVSEVEEYNVILPSCAFSESRGIYVNCLGIAQSTVQAVHFANASVMLIHDASLIGYQSVLTTDIVLYSLLRYLLLDLNLPIFNNTLLSENISNLVSWFKCYFPYQLNYMSDCVVCTQLLRMCKNILFTRNRMYVLSVRSNFDTDIITRNNPLFWSERTNTEEGEIYMYDLVMRNFEDYN